MLKLTLFLLYFYDFFIKNFYFNFKRTFLKYRLFHVSQSNSFKIGFISIISILILPLASATTFLVKEVSVGNSYTCVVKIDDSLVCWGFNKHGQATPPEGRLFKQVSAGDRHTCAVKIDGQLVCWGDNKEGQATPPRGSFKKVSVGREHTCALTATDDSIVCWGDISLGQATPPTGHFQQISVGYLQNCAITNDNRLICWDDIGETLDSVSAGNFKQISVGAFHTCGIKSDGHLACWGENDKGQATPPKGQFKQVSAGREHSCAVKTNNFLACWGNNEYGQARPPEGEFKQVSVGGLHSCGIKTDGSLVCWGYNKENQATVPIPNQIPTDIRISSNQVTEKQPAGTVVGTLTTVDPDLGDNHTYALVGGLGDTDNSFFVIVGNTLQTNAVFEFEKQKNYSIRVQTKDGKGGLFEKSFLIIINNNNKLNLKTPDINETRISHILIQRHIDYKYHQLLVHLRHLIPHVFV